MSVIDAIDRIANGSTNKDERKLDDWDYEMERDYPYYARFVKEYCTDTKPEKNRNTFSFCEKWV